MSLIQRTSLRLSLQELTSGIASDVANFSSRNWYARHRRGHQSKPRRYS